MKYLILGDGLLGTEIHKITSWDYISRKKDKIDLNYPPSYLKKITNYDVIINCIAYTNTYDENKFLHWQTNYIAVKKLCDSLWNFNQRLIHISTDYVYANSQPNASEEDLPIPANNWYSLTKLLGDCYAQLNPNNLIIRTSFKPRPFPYSQLVMQYGNFDYVDIIAPIIVKMIEKNAKGLYNVGTEEKSIKDLALRTRSDIIVIQNKIHNSIPHDVTMNINKMKEIIK